MTAKTTKTIDNLGFHVYQQYEDDRKRYEDEYSRESKNIASQLQTDIFEPILISDYEILFDLKPKPSSWSFLHAPGHFNEQKKRLFTHQLAPKLGPEEYLEMQIERIEDVVVARQKETQNPKENKERLFSWQGGGDIEHIAKQAQTLIDLLEHTTMLNKIITDTNAERYRYAKG